MDKEKTSRPHRLKTITVVTLLVAGCTMPTCAHRSTQGMNMIHPSNDESGNDTITDPDVVNDYLYGPFGDDWIETGTGNTDIIVGGGPEEEPASDAQDLPIHRTKRQ
jgi:Ca2+-binding RTX toxin-like protein